MTARTSNHPHPVSEGVPFDDDLEGPSSSVSCAIHQLPSELLLLVFEAAKEITHETRKEGKKTRTRERPVQVTASHVCRYWRAIALTAPSLWTTINIDFSLEVVPFARDYTPLFARVRTYLARSGDLAIDIRIVHELDDQVSIAVFNSLLSMLLSHLRRWSTFKFISGDHFIRREVIKSLSSTSLPSAPKLKVLELSRGFASFMDKRWFHDNVLCMEIDAPQLISLKLGESLPQCWRSLAASTTTLANLHVSCHVMRTAESWEELIDILGMLRSLKQLSLCNEASDNPPTDNSRLTPATLPLLRRLSLSHISPSRTTYLFQRLSLPNLSKLELVFCVSVPAWFTTRQDHQSPITPSPAHHRGVQPLLPKLTDLTLLGMTDVNAHDVGWLYTHVPSVKRLCINSRVKMFRRTFLRQLLPAPAPAIGGPPEDVSRPPLPQLRTLHLKGVDGTFDDLIREIERTRLAAGIPLLVIADAIGHEPWG
ncbi:hypothetical protein BV22DRAFT_1031536 [Leucogyrophana mollusca]|uniref:Uncharacterized protein n=1 Tax=Leucogyrophana mollusca TaxID=85980 RepID=A0ACB8BPS6_9AGAM|nr:hypothetical protein BV22DRAFT_1031536 [Leucogyrophana mollusca]